jgi:hypothetical protein
MVAATTTTSVAAVAVATAAIMFAPVGATYTSVAALAVATTTTLVAAAVAAAATTGCKFYNTFVCCPVWSRWSPIGCLLWWLIGECSPDMAGTGEIKYSGQNKTSTAALQ